MTSLPLSNDVKPERIHGQIVEGETPATWEHVMGVLWFLVTFMSFPGDAFLLYPLALGLIVLFAVRRRETVPLFARAVLLFTVPVLTMLSFMYSPYPSEAIREGALHIMTALSVVVFAQRFTARELIRIIFLAGAISTLVALPNLETFSHGGPYGSKNQFAIQMLFVLLLAQSVLFNREEASVLRLLAVPIIGLTLFYILISDSATSLVFAFVALVSMASLGRLWPRIARVRHLRSLILLFGLILVCIGALVVINVPGGLSMNDFLTMLGRDATFTGRTAIWDAGNRIAQENWLLGVGAEGFWQYDVGAAQTINENDFKEFGTKLTFHNAFLEVRVHLGMIGLVFFAAIVAWVTYRIIRQWLIEPSTERGTYVATAVIILASSLTESWLWQTLNTSVFLFYLGALTTLKGSADNRRKQDVVLEEDMAEQGA